MIKKGTNNSKATATIPLFTVHMPHAVDRPLLTTLHSGYIGQGPRVDEFEAILANFFNTENVLTLNSGTSSLQLALRLANVSYGDEVISTPMTCSATNEPILAQGAKIVWADIDPHNGLISCSDIARKITPKTKAIMAVDWGGTPCDLNRLVSIANKNNVKIIEDAAHALGAEYNGKRIGSIADFTCFSLQAIKHITTVDGGILVTKNIEDYKKGKLLRWYGINRETERKDFRCEDDICAWGYKFHMNDVSATIGIVQIKYLDKILSCHRENAKYYYENISHEYYVHPETGWKQNSAFWLYTILLPSTTIRSNFMSFMAQNGVMTSQVHARNDFHTAFAEFRCNLPGVKTFSERHVCIPVHWKLTPKERRKIADLVNRFAAKAK